MYGDFILINNLISMLKVHFAPLKLAPLQVFKAYRRVTRQLCWDSRCVRCSAEPEADTRSYSHTGNDPVDMELLLPPCWPQTLKEKDGKPRSGWIALILLQLCCNHFSFDPSFCLSSSRVRLCKYVDSFYTSSHCPPPKKWLQQQSKVLQCDCPTHSEEACDAVVCLTPKANVKPWKLSFCSQTQRRILFGGHSFQLKMLICFLFNMLLF